MLHPFIKIQTDEGYVIENNVVSCNIVKSNITYPTCTFVLSSAGRMKKDLTVYNSKFVEQKTIVTVTMGYSKVDAHNSDVFKAESNEEFQGIVTSVEEIKGRFTITCVDVVYTLRSFVLKKFNSSKQKVNLVDKIKEALKGKYEVETDDFTKDWFIFSKFIQVSDTNVFSFITKFITQANVNIFIKGKTLYIWSPYHDSGGEVTYDSTKNIIDLKLPAKNVNFKRISLTIKTKKKVIKEEEKPDSTAPEEIINISSALINTKEKLKELMPIVVRERRNQRNKVTLSSFLYPFTQPNDKVNVQYLQLINEEFDPSGPFKNQYKVQRSLHFCTRVSISFTADSIKRNLTLEPYETSGNN